MFTITDLPIGAKLKFGAYSVSGETPHKIRWIKVHRDGTILSEFIEDQCAFDAKEPDNPIVDRKTHGNNRYSKSNCQQFLNADDYTDWFRPMHRYDCAPEDPFMFNARYGYAHKPGFLHCFEEWEIEAIDESEVKTALPRCDISGTEECETIRAKVFIPSVSNVNCGAINDIMEGEVWDLFASGARRACKFSPELYDKTPNKVLPEFGDSVWFYYLRSPYRASGDVCCVNESGSILNARACTDYFGVRPALRLNANTLISDKPDVFGYYEVLSPTNTEINEEEFFAILKKM